MHGHLELELMICSLGGLVILVGCQMNQAEWILVEGSEKIMCSWRWLR